MAKKVKVIIKLQIAAGKANPAPPVGPALAQHGVNISEFCQKFNDKTKDQAGFKIPVEITIFKDGSYTFDPKQPLTSELIKKVIGIEKGSGEPNKKKVGKITKSQLKEVAQRKIVDFNTEDMEMAIRIVEGTAKNMGIEIQP